MSLAMLQGLDAVETLLNSYQRTLDKQLLIESTNKLEELKSSIKSSAQTVLPSYSVLIAHFYFVPIYFNSYCVCGVHFALSVIRDTSTEHLNPLKILIWYI